MPSICNAATRPAAIIQCPVVHYRTLCGTSALKMNSLPVYITSTHIACMEICAISSNYCIIMIMANLPVSHIQLCIHMYNTSRLKMVQGQKDKDRLLYLSLSPINLCRASLLYSGYPL